MHGCILSTEQVQFSATGTAIPPEKLPRQDQIWLSSLQMWADSHARHIGVPEARLAAFVLDAFACIAARWATFEAPPGLLTRIARRRWIARQLFPLAIQERRAHRRCPYPRQGTALTAPPPAPDALDAALTESMEPPIDLDPLQRFERVTTAERWRVWLAHEIDGFLLPEVAQQEGRTTARIRQLLALAWTDYLLDLAREEAKAARKAPQRRSPQSSTE